MSRRDRLTRRNKEAVDGNIPYPGNVNQPDRKFKKDDQYDNWKETINHPYPDMRHDWQNDERDSIGFGIPEAWGTSPTVATVRVAANKSVQAAYYLLGNKVAESIVEDQAADFMLLGPEALDRTLARFAETIKLYETPKEAADESEEEADDAAEGKEASEVETLKARLAEVEAKLAEDDSDDSDDSDDAKEAEAKEAAKETETKEASEVETLKAKLAEAESKVKKAEDDNSDDSDDSDDDSKEASVKDLESKLAEVEAKVAEAKEAKIKEADSKEDSEVKVLEAKLAEAKAKVAEAKDPKVAELKAKIAEAEKALDETKVAEEDGDEEEGDSKEAALDTTPIPTVNDMDIQLSPIIADEDVNLIDDPRLAGLFDNDIPAELPEPGAGRREASEKKGIKSIGKTQVKVASGSTEAQDISAIWQDSPDVSDVFR